MSRHHSDVATPIEYNRGRDVSLMLRHGSTNRAIKEVSTKRTKLQLVFNGRHYLRSRHPVEVAT